MVKFLYYLASLIAVVCVFSPHEFAHAFVAYKNGDPTAKIRGRMTLNPLKHIDITGFVLCALVGFGWARPVPVDPFNFRKYRKGLFLTAIAGVTVNYIIAFFAYLLQVLVIRFLYPVAVASEFAYYAVFFLETTFWLIFAYSLYSVVFNLLPLFPLDGFRVVESFTREINPVRRFLRNYGQIILIILIVESFLCGLLVEYVPSPRVAQIVSYFDLLGYLGWFAERIIGFPITAAWNWILKI